MDEMAVSGAFSQASTPASNHHHDSHAYSPSQHEKRAQTLHSMIESGSMVLQDTAHLSSWRPPVPTGDGAVPYLDIMVVNSAQYPKTFDGDEYGTHTRLLIEPISIPSLKHTGVNLRPLPTERNRQRSRVPLFYPDGGKTVQLRHNVRDTLKHPIDRRRFPGTNESIDLDSMEHWNKDGGSRVLVTDRTERHSSSSASTSTKKGKKANRVRSGKNKTDRHNNNNIEGRRDPTSRSSRRSGPLSSVRSSRIGARQRTVETREVLDLMHGTLEKMDRISGRR